MRATGATLILLKLSYTSTWAYIAVEQDRSIFSKQTDLCSSCGDLPVTDKMSKLYIDTFDCCVSQGCEGSISGCSTQAQRRSSW